MGGMDIGQTITIKDGTVIAVEAIEGTDACIERTGELCRRGGWTLVKVSKPNQDMRFDVPTIGPQTIAASSRCRWKSDRDRSGQDDPGRARANLGIGTTGRYHNRGNRRRSSRRSTAGSLADRQLATGSLSVVSGAIDTRRAHASTREVEFVSRTAGKTR